MLLVFLSWCYIFITAFNFGFFVNKSARLRATDGILLVFFGLFSVSIFTGFWAIFYRINIEFHIVLLLLNLLLAINNKPTLLDAFNLLKSDISNLSKSSKWFLGMVGILLLSQSAGPSYFADNEIYYIQTIKWLNEFGFVKGLANLHFFLGQTSGWHVLQSAFNFSFVCRNLNDINGFCLFFGNLFAILKLESDNRHPAFALSLLPVANILLFQFVGAPSPDLAVCVLSMVVFYYFLEHFIDGRAETFNWLFLLSLFIVFIKVTAWPILLLPIIFLARNWKKMAFKMSVCCISGIVVFVLFVSKNLILTGYPLFPAPFFKDLFAMDYAVPDTIYNFWFNTAKLYDFMLTQEEYHHAGVFKIFLRWLLYSKMGSVFNGLILLLLIVTPYFLSRFCNKKPYWILYFAMLLQTVFFFGTSPQYRFMLHYMLFFMMLVVSFFMNRKMISLLPFATLPIIFLLQAFPLKNKTAGMAFQYNTEAFSFNNIIVPCSNSNLKTSYCKIALGNLQYYSPDHHVYIWAIGDAPLPGLNAKQLNYFENKLQYIPQQRTSDLTDGFYSLKISNK